jgi:hypothetical protein
MSANGVSSDEFEKLTLNTSIFEGNWQLISLLGAILSAA